MKLNSGKLYSDGNDDAAVVPGSLNNYRAAAAAEIR